MLIKISDYISKFLIKKNLTNIYCITGGGSMYLNDSFGNNKSLNVIYTHHEQSAAMCSEGESRISGKPGIVCVTSGPGGTNTLTGVAGAWIDSIPMIIFSGQVMKKEMINNQKIRQFGIQEINIVDIVKNITKYSVTIKNPQEIDYHLKKSYYLATSAKKGPVWIDIPLDVQNAIIDTKRLKKFIKPKDTNPKIDYKKILNLLNISKKPLIMTGYGIRSSNAIKEFKKLYNLLDVPFISSWNSSDLFETNSNKYIGRIGIFGDRASNYIQNQCDFILILGSRMSIPQIGYNYDLFAPNAKKVIVDISKKELNKISLKKYIKINCDLKFFINELNNNLKKKKNLNHNNWLKKCNKLKIKYPVLKESQSHINKSRLINSFKFIDVLSKESKKNEIIVTDMGTSFTCTMQTFQTKSNQRLFTSSGLAAMGFGLPGAIGAIMANNNKKRVLCITGDGGLMFNIQEIQTALTHNLKLKLIIIDNQGYLTQKLMMKKNFKVLAGADKKSGVIMPSFYKILKGFGVNTIILKNKNELRKKIKLLLKDDKLKAMIVKMDPFQPLIPRYQSKINKDGVFVKQGLESMFPFLKEKEHQKNLKI